MEAESAPSQFSNGGCTTVVMAEELGMVQIAAKEMSDEIKR